MFRTLSRGCALAAQRLQAVGGSQQACVAAAAPAAQRCYASQDEAGPSKVVVSLLLERLPVIVKTDEEWELDYQAWRMSLKERYFKVYPKEFLEGKSGIELAEDDESRWQPAPSTTPADESGDARTTWRRLDECLYLLVKGNPGGLLTGDWQFPCTLHSDPETVRQTAERCQTEAIEEGPQTHFIGNAPMGHYPTPDGTLFFMRTQLIQGDVKLNTQYNDFAWVAKDEVNQYIKDEGLQKLLCKILI